MSTPLGKHGVLMLGAGVVLLVGAAYVISSSNRTTPRHATKASDTSAASSSLPKLFPSLADTVGSVAKVTIRARRESGEKTVELVRAPAGSTHLWAIANRAMFPASDDRVRELVRRLADLEVVEPKTKEPSLYARLGVEDPDASNATSILVTLSDEAGTPIASLIVGKREDKLSQDPTSVGTYVRPQGEAQSSLVKGRVGPSADVADWFHREILREAQGTIASLVIQHPATSDGAPGETVTITRGGRGSDSLTWLERPSERELVEPMALHRPIRVIESLVIDDVVRADTLDFANASRATYTTLDGGVLELRVLTKDAKHYVHVRARHDPALVAPASDKFPQPTPEELAMVAGRFAQLDEALASWAFELPEYRFEELTTKGEALLKPMGGPASEGTSPPSMLAPPQ